MIVKDPPLTLKKANEIVTKILELVRKEMIDFGPVDDPAEQIYLAVHMAGKLCACIAALVEGYGEVYGIQNLTKEFIIKWINVIIDENIEIMEKAEQEQ